jgi:hypothetical protein
VHKRLWPTLLSAVLIAVVPAASAQAKQDKGKAQPTVSFFSGGGGANAHWQHDPADSPNDEDQQDIEINTTTDPNGFAGVDVHHVFGTPTASYPNSSFEVKSNFTGPSLGSPRLVILFSDGGRAELRPLTNTTSWQTVSDPNWDNNGGTCGFLFQTTWNTIQGCHAGTTVTDVFLVADPYGHTHWIDNLNTAGKNWSRAADNGRG